MDDRILITSDSCILLHVYTYLYEESSSDYMRRRLLMKDRYVKIYDGAIPVFVIPIFTMDLLIHRINNIVISITNSLYIEVSGTIEVALEYKTSLGTLQTRFISLPKIEKLVTS